MVAAYRLVGYDRATEFLEASYVVPASKLGAVQKAAGLTPEVAALNGDWPLPDANAQAIARLIGRDIDLQRMAFFLEPCAPQSGPHRTRD